MTTDTGPDGGTTEASSLLIGANSPPLALSDGRQPGEIISRFDRYAWAQILFELIYLTAWLLVCTWILGTIGYHVAAPEAAVGSPLPFDLAYPRDRKLLIWIALATSGCVGGTAFALKWLYHTVAKDIWNVDRLVWRIVVPGLSGVFAVFVAFMVAAGIVPFLNSQAFDHFYRALGTGFLLGYFSDNVLAKLQRLANQWFGVQGGKVEGDQDD